MKEHSKVTQLIARGVIIPSPHLVEVCDDVVVSHIAAGVTIHGGCRIIGASTWIGAGSIIGAEAPVVLDNCQLGREVELKGGYFDRAVFLDGANMGSGAHVRAGTLLEEEANGAHTVGLKQTILLPFVTLGSLINFCDVLMAGGTSRKDHSEVGSSYIHFNFTAHQDKATASLIGDVPRGVFLRQRPIFLGGQGGLVGPARIEYGCVVAAGSVTRRDLNTENKLHLSGGGRSLTSDYDTLSYKGIDRIVCNNLLYIGNILALKAWYSVVRKKFMQRDLNDQACYDGACAALEMVLSERKKRMRDLADKMEVSVELLKNAEGDNSAFIAEQERLICLWPQIERQLSLAVRSCDHAARRRFVDGLDAFNGEYLAVVQSMSAQMCLDGTTWLQSIVTMVTNLWSRNYNG